VRKGISPAITIRLAIIAILLLALLVFSNRRLLSLVTDASDWYTQPSVAVSQERQKVTALHEAAHVVASVTLRGADSAHSVRVYSGVPAASRDTLLGQSDTDMWIRPGSRADALNVAVVLYAGGAAETELLKTQSYSDGSDRREATRALMQRFTDDPAAAERGMSALQNEKDILDFMDDTRAAQYCAQSVVQTNDKVIHALADEIMRQPENFNRRVMDEKQLREFFAAHPVQKPFTVCDF
jgi:ATP-dependent Zn protease